MVNATVLDELIQETRSVLLEENIMEESRFEKWKIVFIIDTFYTSRLSASPASIPVK